MFPSALPNRWARWNCWRPSTECCSRPSEPRAEPSRSPRYTAPSGTKPGLRLLVVEDNPVNRLVATRLLEKQNHTVRTATNGREALDMIEKEKFDCVLMDVQMPVLDGFEATAAIRNKERVSGGHLPIIALTAHAIAGDLERCLAAGMDGYLTKPDNAKRCLRDCRARAPSAEEVPIDRRYPRYLASEFFLAFLCLSDCCQ